MCELFMHPSFFTVSFRDAVLQEPMEVCQKGVMIERNTGSVSFQDFVFRCNRCLSDF